MPNHSTGNLIVKTQIYVLFLYLHSNFHYETIIRKGKKIKKLETSFNILDASFGRLENTHYDILAKLLEPRWGLVNSLFKIVGLDAVSSLFQVFREKHRIDILITDGKRAIIIENKLGASDQPQQLARYYE